MAKLSLNVNKIATLRNARGGSLPCLKTAVEKLLNLGAHGITVHPRPDGRHILYKDVRDIAAEIKKFNDAQGKNIEFNVEGYPSEAFLSLMKECRPHQCTLVPDPPSALTSNEGWKISQHFPFLKKILKELKENQIRSSLFMDPLREEDFLSLEKLRPDRVEFYTGAFAKAFDEGGGSGLLNIYKKRAGEVHKLGIGINAGHDLNQKNLKALLDAIPFIKEVSIGHAFICDALDEGMQTTFTKYKHTLSPPSPRLGKGGWGVRVERKC